MLCTRFNARMLGNNTKGGWVLLTIQRPFTLTLYDQEDLTFLVLNALSQENLRSTLYQKKKNKFLPTLLCLALVLYSTLSSAQEEGQVGNSQGVTDNNTGENQSAEQSREELITDEDKDTTVSDDESDKEEETVAEPNDNDAEDEQENEQVQEDEGVQEDEEVQENVEVDKNKEVEKHKDKNEINKKMPMPSRIAHISQMNHNEQSSKEERVQESLEPEPEPEPEGPAPCTCGIFLSSQFKKGSKEQPKGLPVLEQEIDTPFMDNAIGNRQCMHRCLEVIIMHLPKSNEIICATVDKDHVHREKAFLFIKNHSHQWHETKMSAGREFCCKDNLPYKCNKSRRSIFSLV